MSRLRRLASRTVKDAASRRGIRVERIPAPLLEHRDAELRVSLDLLIADHMRRAGAHLFFLQIGAFDGLSRDPLHEYVTRYDWRGILVEPQRRYFELLIETYRGRAELELKNVAVADRPGTRSFYRIRDDAGELPEWVPQLASFDLDMILRHEHAHPGLRELIVEEQIECVTPSQLLAGADRLDLLQIDAEGYDAEIIRMFDFDRWRPAIVHFEHLHLGAEEYDRALRRLIGYGYRVAQDGDDTMGYRPA